MIAEDQAEDLAPDSAGGQLADRIARDVLASRSPAGTVIASEQELRLLHDAGRSVFRQAVRILEERGVAYMRRGHGGGLVVAEPNADFPARALSIVLESLTADLSQLAILPAAIDNHLYLHSAARLTLDQCRDLKRLMHRLDALPNDEFLRVAAHRVLNEAMRTASGEPAVILACKTSSEYGVDLVPYSVSIVEEGTKGPFWTITCENVAAITAGDVGAMFDCRARLIEIIRSSVDSWGEIERDPQRAPRIDDVQRPEFQLSSNQAERLAREILREIRLMGWKSGARIGGSAELMKRYGASTNILRQAARMLQEHAAVEVERGRNGGLFIATPDRGRAIERAIAYLRQSAPRAADVKAFLVQVILQALDKGGTLGLGQLHAELGEGAFVTFADLCRGAAQGLGAAPEMFADILLPLLPPEGPSTVSVQSALDAFASSDPGDRRRVILAAANGPGL